nr:FAD-binding oxidoreductase [Angustibacter aerolatus]
MSDTAVGHPLLVDLAGALPADRVVTDPDVAAGYAHDEAEWAAHGRPLAVVRPRSPEEVQAVVRACLAHRVPVVPRGAGTGLSGGANAVDGCVVLSLERMDAVHEIDPVERLAVVGPGVVNDHLRAAAAEHGLWYPPDPARLAVVDDRRQRRDQRRRRLLREVRRHPRLRDRAAGGHRHRRAWCGSDAGRRRAWRATTWSG